MESPDADPGEWEYEYDTHETEVFLVDLDLTSANRNFKSTTANRHKRLLDVNSKPAARKRQKVSNNAKRLQPRAADTPSRGVRDHDAEDQNGNSVTPNQEILRTNDVHAEEEGLAQHGLQLLDPHTSNPIVSYRGQLHSCAWIDTVGTTMFFSEPRDTPLYDPEISTSAFDLIGTSRIKLVGREAHVTPTAQTGQDRATSSANEQLERPGQSLGTIKRSNAKLNADLRKQANFLEQLMNIKKNRGEQDNVHVIMNSDVAACVAEGKLKHNTRGRAQQIDELNKRVVRGDAEALHKLEQIYSGQDLGDSDNDDGQINFAAASVHGPSSLHYRTANEPDAEFEEDSIKSPRVIGTASPSSESPSPTV